MANFFDHFDGDEQNPFDSFDAEGAKPDAPIRFMDEPSTMDKFLGMLPDWMSNVRGTAPGRLIQGAADMGIGATQLVANALPDATGIPQAVNKRVADLETDYQAQRRANNGGEDPGFDGWRVTGNVLSPGNLALAAKVPFAVTKGARAAQGAAIGGGTAAMQPVTDTDDGFWGQKAGQTALGVAAGAVLTPALGAIGDKVVRRLQLESPAKIAARSAVETNRAIDKALDELGQSIHDIPPAQLQALRQQVTEALQTGKQLDPAALMRKADFDALGIQPTTGQLTRDPMQFARERNLRGVENVGEALSARFQTQGNQLQQRIAAKAAGAKDAYTAGNQIAGSLSRTDEALRRHVSGLYGEARASVGKELDVPLQGFAAEYGDILHRYADAVPKGVQNMLNDYGLMGGKQTKAFTFEEADKVLKQINKMSGSDRATSSALFELRGALRRTLESVDASGGPYAPAVKAAAERFKLHDAVPALRAAAEGSVAPDDFVRRFIISGKTDDVKGLSKVLKQADPEAWQEARAQLADALKRAAYGENAAGDAPLRLATYMETLRRIGVTKLAAFFDAQEVADILRVGRVGAFINQAPNASAPNTSGTASAVMNMLARAPGASAIVGVGKRVADTVQNKATVSNALAASIAARPAPLSPVQRNWLAYILAGGASGSGAFAGREIGE